MMKIEIYTKQIDYILFMQGFHVIEFKKDTGDHYESTVFLNCRTRRQDKNLFLIETKELLYENNFYSRKILSFFVHPKDKNIELNDEQKKFINDLYKIKICIDENHEKLTHQHKMVYTEYAGKIQALKDLCVVLDYLKRLEYVETRKPEVIKIHSEKLSYILKSKTIKSFVDVHDKLKELKKVLYDVDYHKKDDAIKNLLLLITRTYLDASFFVLKIDKKTRDESEMDGEMVEKPVVCESDIF